MGWKLNQWKKGLQTWERHDQLLRDDKISVENGFLSPPYLTWFLPPGPPSARKMMHRVVKAWWSRRRRWQFWKGSLHQKAAVLDNGRRLSFFGRRRAPRR